MVDPRGHGDQLTVLHGAGHITQVVHELLRTARHRVRRIVRAPSVPVVALDAVERTHLAGGVDHQVIYDRAALTSDDQVDRVSGLVGHGEQARIGAELPMSLVLVDAEAGLIPIGAPGATVGHAVLARGRGVAGALDQVYDDLWHAATPFVPEAATERDAPTDQERMLLSLLASGATDETIGRLMGSSARTAHRRVRELIARLGVQTRFQAGMRAVHLGWLAPPPA
ncbi:MAG TPA: DNA-binding response regulator [Pseudonocardiaceae bacterium]